MVHVGEGRDLINFRYHIVSLVAIFLALGLGVLFGASFVDQAIVDGLRKSQGTLGDRNEKLREQNAGLQQTNDAFSDFVSRTRLPLVHGSLKDRVVVVVAYETATKDAVDSVIDAVVQAGGAFEGLVTLTGKLDMKSPERRRQVALALSSSSDEQQVLSLVLNDEIAAALAGKKPGTFQRLADAGLVTFTPGPGARPRPASEVAPSGAAVVFIGGPDSVELTKTLLEPVVRSLADAQVVTAVVQEGAADLETLKGLRAGGVRAVTVDGIDQPIGQVALVLGLKAAFGGRFGHYGTGEGAASVLPELTAP